MDSLYRRAAGLQREAVFLILILYNARAAFPERLMSDRDPNSVFLSIVFPAYNKETRIAASIDATVAYLAGKPFAAEVIVVDDGSRDRTAEVARMTLAGRVP